MTVALDLWMPSLLARLPGAEETFVRDELKKTVKDFCYESTAWREFIRDVSIVQSIRVMSLQGGSDREVLGILGVYRNDMGVAVADRPVISTLDSWLSGWKAGGDNPALLELSAVPTENIPNALNVLCFFGPVNYTAEDTVWPEILTQTYWGVIFDGVLGRMYSQPAKPYTNGISAQYHLKRYLFGTRKALSRAVSGHTPNGHNWSFPPFR